ncbi:hypothetical protein NC651_031430 [Populus alba x Populus x berolinensis]|nr:hypothetical protein NC651_031430 [Populus alba x Populus x berolinensis]
MRKLFHLMGTTLTQPSTREALFQTLPVLTILKQERLCSVGGSYAAGWRQNLSRLANISVVATSILLQ